VWRSLAGKLLVASPILDDPNFARSVVLICTHDRDGAFGLVLNRPLREQVTEYLPGWSGSLVAPEVIFSGGPVDVTSAFGLARGVATEGAWLSPPLGAAGEAQTGMVDLDAIDALVAAGIEAVRVYSGYAGWVGGQLESELLTDSWFVVDALPADPFTAAPDTLWHEVMRRQTHGELAMFGYYPDGPRVN
jgi:putative transcriptional regulator